MQGQSYGRLRVLTETRKEVEAICECGNTRWYARRNLLSGNTISCGCYRNERIKAVCGTHGQNPKDGRTRTYAAWAAMKQRCDNSSYKLWHRYGGRGITYCVAWGKFEAFYADMGDCPEGLEIDRRDNNGSYCKENCRWITREENKKNKGY